MNLKVQRIMAPIALRALLRSQAMTHEQRAELSRRMKRQKEHTREQISRELMMMSLYMYEKQLKRMSSEELIQERHRNATLRKRSKSSKRPSVK